MATTASATPSSTRTISGIGVPDSDAGCAATLGQALHSNSPAAKCNDDCRCRGDINKRTKSKTPRRRVTAARFRMNHTHGRET